MLASAYFGGLHRRQASAAKALSHPRSGAPMIPDGYLDLDPRRLATLVTYLEHDLKAAPARMPLPKGSGLQPLDASDLDRYRALFRAIGQDWLWFSRLRMSDLHLGAILDHDAVRAFALADETGDLGLLELDFRDQDAPELAYFGLVPRAIGIGVGRALMGRALDMARAAGVARLLVHTCSLDHPAALSFYVRSGFRPYKRAIEVFDDPRLDGTLPRDAAAWLPVIEP
jgi:GNAT superfamily N-acetyltransferase